jgi:uncharacterized protein (UPF0248 family)
MPSLAQDCALMMLTSLGSAPNRVMLVRAVRAGSMRAFTRANGQHNLIFQMPHLHATSTPSGRDDAAITPEPMANLCQEWTIDHDQLLWKNQREPASALASLMGRGIRGVEMRLAKLKDVNSKAYERLFSGQRASIDDDEISKFEKKKLMPASEVLRRIKWDSSLTPADFSILHYDRVEDRVVESPFDAPNTSISGKATALFDALPEHRIVGIKYKERVVWDREQRLDLVFTSPGIRQTILDYDEWKRQKDDFAEFERQRQAQVSEQLQQVLGRSRIGVCLTCWAIPKNTY